MRRSASALVLCFCLTVLADSSSAKEGQEQLVQTCLEMPLLPDIATLESMLTICTKEIEKTSTKDSVFPRLLWQRGAAHLNLGQYEPGLRDLQRAEVLLPLEADLQADLGLANLRSGRYEAAEQKFTTALALERTWQSLQGRCWARFYLRKREAFDDCDEVVAKHRTADTLAQLAFMTANLDYADEAVGRDDVTPFAFYFAAYAYIQFSDSVGTKAPLALHRKSVARAEKIVNQGLERFPDDEGLTRLAAEIQSKTNALEKSDN